VETGRVWTSKRTRVARVPHVGAWFHPSGTLDLSCWMETWTVHVSRVTWLNIEAAEDAWFHNKKSVPQFPKYPGISEYDRFFGEGFYECAWCETSLSKSSTKFNSGCG
jgi:hypothetical protein